MNYADYIAAFNTGDDAALVERFFADDIVFQSASRICRGKKELLDFLNWAHDGIREIIRAQLVLRDENHIFAEIDMDFRATRDRPDFLFGALKKGEYLTVKFLVVYYLRDGKIYKFKGSNWPANIGVTKPQVRLGGSLEERQAFFDYSQAFSNADFDKFSAYYTEDCTLTIRDLKLNSRKEIVDFYRAMFARIRESLIVHQVVADENGIAADITSRFTALEDATDFAPMPLKKGQVYGGRVFVHYALRDGKICSIRVARAGDFGELE